MFGIKFRAHFAAENWIFGESKVASCWFLSSYLLGLFELVKPKSFCCRSSSHTHPSIRQAKHSKLDPASCRQMDAARRFSYLPLRAAIGNIWQGHTHARHTRGTTRCSAVRHSWRSLDERRWQTIRWPLTHTHPWARGENWGSWAIAIGKLIWRRKIRGNAGRALRIQLGKRPNGPEWAEL